MSEPVQRMGARGGMRREIYKYADKFARNPERVERRSPPRVEGGNDYMQCLASLWHNYGRQVVNMSRDTALELISKPVPTPLVFDPQPLAIEIAVPPALGIQCRHGDDLQSIFLLDLRAQYEGNWQVVVTEPGGFLGALRVFRGCSGELTAKLDDFVTDDSDVARLMGHTLARLQELNVARRRPVRMRHGMPTTTQLWLWDMQPGDPMTLPQEQDEELGAKLRRLDKRDVPQLEVGDTVYEAVVYGGRTKYKELRVMGTDGGEAVRIADPEHKQKPRSVFFSKLMIEAAVQKPVRRLAAVPDSAAAGRPSTPPPLDDDDMALLELSREKLAKVDRELAEAKDRRAALRAETDAAHDKRIASHEAQIKALEAQIATIKQEREHDRKIAQKTRSELDEQIDYLEGRRKTLQQYIDASAGTP